MTAQEQMAAMRAAVQAELPALARELVTLSDQGFYEGGRFRELARSLTELPEDQRLNIVIGEIKRVALEAVAAAPAESLSAADFTVRPLSAVVRTVQQSLDDVPDSTVSRYRDELARHKLGSEHGESPSELPSALSAAEAASMLDRLDNLLSAHADAIPGAVYDEIETVVNTLKQAEIALAPGHRSRYQQPTHAEAIKALHMAIGEIGAAHGVYVDKGVPEIIAAHVLAYFKPAAESERPAAEIRWTCSDTDDVYLGGNYDSEPQAIAAALDNYPDAETIYIGKIKPVDIRRLIRGDHLIEAIGERAYDEVGEVAEHWPSLSKEDVAELEGIVAGFVLGKSPVTFFTVEGEKTYTREAAEALVASSEGPKA